MAASSSSAQKRINQLKEEQALLENGSEAWKKIDATIEKIEKRLTNSLSNMEDFSDSVSSLGQFIGKNNKYGLDASELVKNLKKYRKLADEDDLSNDELIRTYLDMCRFHPVSFGEGSATNPEQGKIDAMEEFIRYVKRISHQLQKKAFMKNKIGNYFTPFVGFSDDDVRNVETMKKHFDKKDNNILKTYLTAGGKKRLY